MALYLGTLHAVETDDGRIDIDPTPLGYSEPIGIFTAPSPEDIAKGLAYAEPPTKARPLRAIYYEGRRQGGQWWRHAVRRGTYRAIDGAAWIRSPDTTLRPDLFLEH